MVFAALIEYAAVGYIGKRINLRSQKVNDLRKDNQHKYPPQLYINQPQHPDVYDRFHHQINSNLSQSNLMNPNFASTGQLIDYNQHFSNDNQQLIIPGIHQLVQLTGNNMLSSTNPSTTYAQTPGNQTQLPSSSNTHPVAHFATIRRNVLERTGPLGAPANATPRLIHRPQEVRLVEVHGSGSKALTVAQSTDDNFGTTGNRKNCTNQSSTGNLVGQQLIQRNVPHSNHHLPTTSAINVTTPSHLDHHSTIHSRTITTPRSKMHHYPFGPQKNKEDTFFGCKPSDIDKYSRVVFPVCFVCFNLMYWVSGF